MKENLYESQFCQFCDENMYLAFEFVLNENQSGSPTTSHSA